ncbi:MAG: glycosyltransferase [Thermoplasmata archaeon]|nr:glycosyltransferase [Thermoplasmata archaeon]
MNEASAKSERKRVMIIASLYHATPRIPTLAKFLPEFGWEPIIITPKLIEGNIFNIPSKEALSRLNIVETGEPRIYEQEKKSSKSYPIKKSIQNAVEKIDSSHRSRLRHHADAIFWKLHNLFNYPDPEREWRQPVVEKAVALYNEKKFDLIISSSSPIITHLAALDVKEKFGTPWVAELRDLWSQNQNLPYGRMMRWVISRLERRTLQHANTLVTISPNLAKDLQSLHSKKEVHCLTNGFDPAIMDIVAEHPSKFTITYTGQIYWPKMKPEILFEAIKDMISNGIVNRNSIEFRHYGPYDNHLERLSVQLGLEDVIKQYGVISRDESLKAQKSSHVLLVIHWEDRDQPGMISTKLLEYLSTGNPILITGGFEGSIVCNIIQQTNTGKVCHNKAQTIEYLSKLYQEYAACKNISIDSNRDEIDKFNYRNIARNYSILLDGILSSSRK